MTDLQFTHIWHRPKEKALDVSNAHAKVLKGQLVHDWANAICASLDAQKELKSRG